MVLIIDHADELNFPQLKPFFTNLYFIFRKLEPRLHIIFITSTPLIESKGVENFGAIGKLFTQHLVKISLLNKEDSVWFIGEETEKLGKNISKSDTEEIIRLSGGFPRTIKRLTEAVKHGYKLSEICENPKLFLPLSLHLEELAIYTEYMQKVPICKSYFGKLNDKSMEENVGGIKLVSRLTKNEEKLLKILLTRRNEIVTREKGIESLWNKKAINVSDHAYDQIVHRLKRKLEGSEPRVVVETVRGRGHTAFVK